MKSPLPMKASNIAQGALEKFERREFVLGGQELLEAIVLSIDWLITRNCPQRELNRR